MLHSCASVNKESYVGGLACAATDISTGGTLAILKYPAGVFSLWPPCHNHRSETRLEIKNLILINKLQIKTCSLARI